jgi:hypothetical protein
MRWALLLLLMGMHGMMHMGMQPAVMGGMPGPYGGMPGYERK